MAEWTQMDLSKLTTQYDIATRYPEAIRLKKLSETLNNKENHNNVLDNTVSKKD